MKIYLPYFEILWKKIPATLKEIKWAGYDGVECHLIGNLKSIRRVETLSQEAKNLGLEIRFHQGWSWNTGQRNIFNYLLRPFLVPVDMSIYHQIENTERYPTVIYGNLVNKIRRPNLYYQTASEHINGKSYDMDFEYFKYTVKLFDLPIVFDTQHIFEWLLDKESVADINITSREIEERIVLLWVALHTLVKEIHLCDFNPLLGASKGRNVFLGEGIFPLQSFCSLVKFSEWDGIVTPEVNPIYMKNKHSLRLLRNKVLELFEK